jgi:threonine synthase
MSPTSAYRVEFACINPECGARYPVDRPIYRCEACSDLLDVEHDLTPLRKHAAGYWIDLFERRWRRAEWPYGSGVWGKREWVLPTVSDDNIVSMYEGGSNLFWAERLGSQLGLGELWIKMCGNSHTGSFKDLGMTVLVSMVKQMRSEGVEIPAVACASTGDTSAALAAYCAAAGIPSVVLLPRAKVSAAQLVQPLANGALVLSLDTDFDGCMAIVQKLVQRGLYLANSMNSLRIEGQKTVGIEIVQQMEWEVPDFIIIPGGNLGNVSALGKGLELMHTLGLIPRLPRLVCAQAARANPLYTSYTRGWAPLAAITAGQTAASAIRIGNPVSFERAVRVLKRFDGIVTQATEQELADAAARADRTGTFACPHTGVALAALIQLVERGEIGRGQRVVVISTANGLKFTEFKTAYHEGRLADVSPRLANRPVELEASEEASWRAIAQFLERST